MNPNSSAAHKEIAPLASLWVSLTFWILAGAIVWLNIALINDLNTPDSDVFRIFGFTILWYGAIGMILWLPVFLGAKFLRAISIFGRHTLRLQLSLHWLVAFTLTFTYLIHKIWLPYDRALSTTGLLVTLAIIAVGFATGGIFGQIASRLGVIPFFNRNSRVLLSLFVVIFVVYGVGSLFSAMQGRFQTDIPPGFDQAYDTNAKVMLIGFDGATWEAINPLMAQGLMPNFKRFLDDGGMGKPLASDRPTLSAILWTTVATGKTSKGHGVTEIVSVIAPGLKNNILNYPYTLGCYNFVQLLMKRGFFYVTPLSSSARRTKAVWNMLSDYNKRVGVVGWWGSFPPEEVNGVIVSDHASMQKQEMRVAKGQQSIGDNLPADVEGMPVYPAELTSEILPFAEQTAAMNMDELHYFLPGDSAYLAFVNNLNGWDRKNRESVIKISYLTDKFFMLTTEYLLKSQSFDLLMGYYFEADANGHWLWPYREAEYFPEIPPDQVNKFKDVIDSTYVNLDRMFGTILDNLPEDCHVIVVSDHGFGVEDFGDYYVVGHALAPDGILMMEGPAFKSDVKFRKQARLEDITPTILALLGIPVGEDMQGRVLEEAFTDEFLNQFPIRTIPSHDRGEKFRARATLSGEDDILKEKLRALGYIE
ncbi:alkaline phosphatase family protein [bacterium]|nr:alkaline phosphatase family protein [bacterium]